MAIRTAEGARTVGKRVSRFSCLPYIAFTWPSSYSVGVSVTDREQIGFAVAFCSRHRPSHSRGVYFDNAI